MDGIFNIFSNITDGLSIMFLNNLWEGLLSLIIKLSMWVLGLIRPILRLIFNVARIDFFGEDIIGDLLGRVYMILGILMLFKITISCVQYLINPDKADDKENGFGGIIKRTIICVMLLALVKPIFNFAKEAQMAIIETLPKVILGTEKGIDTDDITENIAYTTALGFFGYNEGCNNGKIGGLSGASSNALFNSIEDISKNSQIITGDKSCNGNSAYSFNYLCIFAAGFLVVILVSMAVDVGIRTIKFGFLQLIAPVPIASYIDPKTSKKSFDSWVHNSISVYVDLFIRLGVIYFILFLFKTIMSTFKGSYVLTDGETITGFDAGFVNVLIIIALFMFAKNAPKFICDVLGIKDSGSLTDMFKRAGGLAGSGLGGMRTGISNYVTQRERLKAQGKGPVASRLRAALSAAAGAGSATARGMKMATFDKKGFRDVRNDSFKKAVAARDRRNDRVDNLYNDEYGRMDYIKDRARSNLGIPSGHDFAKTQYDTMQGIAKLAADAKGHGAGKMNETPTLYDIKLDSSNINENMVMNALGFDSMSIERVRNLYQIAKNNGGKVQNSAGSTVTLTNTQMEALGDVVQRIEKRTSYLKEAHLMGTGDPAATGYLGQLRLAIKSNTTMFNDDIMPSIQGKFKNLVTKYGITANNPQDLLRCLDELEKTVASPPVKPADYDTNPASKSTYDTAYGKFMADVEKRADILMGLKDAFEEVEKVRKIPAKIAEERAKKARQAVENNKKGS